MTRVVITAGHPTDRELAAIVAALATLTAHARGVGTRIRSQQSAWTSAARLEGRGHPPVDDPTRLRSYRSPLGTAHPADARHRHASAVSAPADRRRTSP